LSAFKFQALCFLVCLVAEKKQRNYACLIGVFGVLIFEYLFIYLFPGIGFRSGFLILINFCILLACF